jgi:hypothetical protein
MAAITAFIHFAFIRAPRLSIEARIIGRRTLRKQADRRRKRVPEGEPLKILFMRRVSK